MVARVDADIILDDADMAKPGALFKVERDFQLNEQQYKMLGDSRMGIERASGITPSFQGQEGTATSGVQENAQIEQTTQALADLMDNFRYGRTMVGELLVSMLIEDLGTRQEEVVISARPPRKERRVVLNQPAGRRGDGHALPDNDVQRIRLKVALEDVPTTSSFRAQQLAAMSEAFKAMPQQIQVDRAAAPAGPHGRAEQGRNGRGHPAGSRGGPDHRGAGQAAHPAGAQERAVRPEEPRARLQVRPGARPPGARAAAATSWPP
jgi:hypothetical protein